MTAGNGLSVAYASYNKPTTITRGTNSLFFSHDPERQRYQQIAPGGTTVYLADAMGSGVLVEQFSGSGGSTQWNNYLFNAVGDRPPAPPGYNSATWRYEQLISDSGEITDRLIDPDGRYWTAHPEDDGHWRHWDVRDPNDPDGGGGNQERWPEKSLKPWPTQVRAPYGNQSATDPNGDAPEWQPPTDASRAILPGPFFPGSRIPILRFTPNLVPVIP